MNSAPVCSSSVSRADTASRASQWIWQVSLWERLQPRSSHRGGWHRLCRCSRLKPLPQGLHQPSERSRCARRRDVSLNNAPACSSSVSRADTASRASQWIWQVSLWERLQPRSSHRGGWHRLRRCSRLKPLPQGLQQPSSRTVRGYSSASATP
ncbi:hypothetical protein CQW31_01235 [Pseudomonas sp. 382]|nr:hypothetical protein CQW31_01235 [Pseudomonas sp. 382]